MGIVGVGMVGVGMRRGVTSKRGVEAGGNAVD